MTILEIMQEIRDCERAVIDPETGEFIGEELDIEKLDALNLARDTKVDNLVSLFKETAAKAEAVKAEKMKLAARQSALEKEAERISDYIALVLNYAEKFESARNRVTWRKSPATVRIDCDVTALPEAYRKAEWKPMKKELLAALKSGEEIEGCSIEDDRTNIVIK